MASYLDNLKAAKEGAAAQLAALYADTETVYVTYSENGRQFLWGEKEAQLLKTIANLDGLINSAQPGYVVTKCRTN